MKSLLLTWCWLCMLATFVLGIAAFTTKDPDLGFSCFVAFLGWVFGGGVWHSIE